MGGGGRDIDGWRGEREGFDEGRGGLVGMGVRDAFCSS